MTISVHPAAQEDAEDLAALMAELDAYYGGGWFDEHWSCRASVRRRGHPDFQVDDVGFRLARSAPR